MTTAALDIDLRPQLEAEPPTVATAQHVLFASAEYGPAVKVGGLGEASNGLVSGLRLAGVEVSVVMPDYGLIDLLDATERQIGQLPSWCPPVTARTGWAPTVGKLTLLHYEGSIRPHPYNDPETGLGWPDNNERFMIFSAAVAALAIEIKPDVVHLNDWHTSAAAALLPEDMATVLTIHNLAYQGVDDATWATRFGKAASTFIHDDAFNPLAAGITLADEVVMVSKSYANEAMSEEGGCGLHHRLLERDTAIRGIRNGIDLDLWSPADDVYLPENFDAKQLGGKATCRAELLERTGLEGERGPVIGMVARFVHQKGIDLALDLVPYLSTIRAKFILMGSGAPAITAKAQEVAALYPEQFAVFAGYDEKTAHLIVAGSDLFLVPSRFEPCGLTQMQAMTCGTIPVVTGVGGLRDTVIDTDSRRRAGTGFVAAEPTPLAILDALHRAARGWSTARRRQAIQRRGMTADWSWAGPARRYLSVYEDAISTQAHV